MQHSFHVEITALVLLNLFINGNEICRIIEALQAEAECLNKSIKSAKRFA